MASRCRPSGIARVLSTLAGLLIVGWGAALAARGPAPVERTLSVGVTKTSISYDLARLDTLPAGVAGFDEVVFVGSPLEGRVLALSRKSGEVIGELAPPAEGFLLPFMMHAIGERRVGVLDAGGLPSPDPFIPASPTIYEYSFEVSARHGFSARLERAISFASVPIAFAEDFALLDDGTYVLSDAIFGAIWIATPAGDILPGIVPPTFDFTTAVPELMMCMTMPLIEVEGIPFLFSGSTLPGVSPLAVRGGELFFYSPCAEGLFAVPLASLFDDRLPHERAADIRLVSGKPQGIVVEQLLGLASNPFDPDDRHLYAADSLQLRIVRIDVDTGEREVIADDPQLFNFPSSMSFVPPVGRIQSLLVASNQQHRMTMLNDAIEEDLLVPPFIVAKIYLKPNRHCGKR